MIYFIFKDRSNQWRWRLMAENQRVIADSAEDYWNRRECLAGIERMKKAADAPIQEI